MAISNPPPKASLTSKVSESSTDNGVLAKPNPDVKPDARDSENEEADSDLSGSGASSSIDSGTEKLASAVYADGGQSRFYEPIASYEGRHRWDPHAVWDEKEEKKLVRKVCASLAAWHE
jgi:hypothetical protein